MSHNLLLIFSIALNVLQWYFLGKTYKRNERLSKRLNDKFVEFKKEPSNGCLKD